MAKELCIPVRYHFHRNSADGTWRLLMPVETGMGRVPQYVQPGTLDGDIDTDNRTYAKVHVFVPCAENGSVAKVVKADYLGLAQARLAERFPGQKYDWELAPNGSAMA